MYITATYHFPLLNQVMNWKPTARSTYEEWKPSTEIFSSINRSGYDFLNISLPSQFSEASEKQ